MIHAVLDGRHFRRIGLIGLAVLLVFSGCGKRGPEVYTRELLGTLVKISVYDNGDHVKGAVEEGFAAMQKVQDTMNRFDPGSELAALNGKAGAGWTEVSDGLLHVIRSSVRYSKETEGAFDVTVLPLMGLWDFNAEEPKAPSQTHVDAMLRLVGSDRIVVDDERKKILLPITGMGVDLGAIAKGYAVDRAVAALERGGIGSGMVVGGGNIAFVGLPPGRPHWNIGVRHPRDKTSEVGVIHVASGAVATSGEYEKYVILNGKRYSHIIDPKTGWPVESNVASVSILAPTAEEADALSTAVFVMGAKEGMKFVEAREGIEAVIITLDAREDIKVLLSTGLKDRYTPFSPE